MNTASLDTTVLCTNHQNILFSQVKTHAQENLLRCWKSHRSTLITQWKKPQLTSYLKFIEAVAFMDNPNSAGMQSCGLRLNKGMRLAQVWVYSVSCFSPPLSGKLKAGSLNAAVQVHIVAKFCVDCFSTWKFQLTLYQLRLAVVRVPLNIELRYIA